MGGHRYNLSTMNAAEFLPDVRAVLEERNEPSYRIRQIYKALTGSLVRDWREATNLPRGLQAALSEEAPAAALALERVSQATDGTRKYLFHTRDGHAIETVMIPEKARRTVCISTQVGCPMGCTFCATGLLGIKRNLKAREIAEQAFVCARDIAPERVSNVVVMGMGEPMLNYNATLGALRVLNDPEGFGLAARHIAVSTSGLVEKIRRFADEPEQFHLAISLHTPFEEERREIMPVAARHTIPELMDAARYFVSRTRRKLFFEYTLLAVAPRRGSGGPSRPPAVPPEPAPLQLDGYGLFGHLEGGGQEIPRARQRARPLGDTSSQPGPGHRCRLRPARREGPARASRVPMA
jgi:23S rRNA (adenine2503-C2)-methyltransferase